MCPTNLMRSAEFLAGRQSPTLACAHQPAPVPSPCCFFTLFLQDGELLVWRRDRCAVLLAGRRCPLWFAAAAAAPRCLTLPSLPVQEIV